MIWRNIIQALVAFRWNNLLIIILLNIFNLVNNTKEYIKFHILIPPFIFIIRIMTALYTPHILWESLMKLRRGRSRLSFSKKRMMKEIWQRLIKGLCIIIPSIPESSGSFPRESLMPLSWKESLHGFFLQKQRPARFQ